MSLATLLVRSERLTPRPDGTWELVLVLAPHVPRPNAPSRPGNRPAAHRPARPAVDVEGVRRDP
jgi:hypothetical protein